MTNQRKVLIVEDEPDIANLVSTHLQDMNCAPDIAGTGQRALELFDRNTYQLIILDLMLPDTDGLSLCTRMRRSEIYTPILMLTAKSTELDRVLGLEIGADDYLTKPFSVPELMARIKALFRRSEAMANSKTEQISGETIQRGNMTIETDKRRVTINKQEIDLTAREFDLLLFFARHPGRVYNRMQLLDQVWGYQHDGYEHTVNSHINRLRGKVEADPAKPIYIQTVWGVGYKFGENQANSDQ